MMYVNLTHRLLVNGSLWQDYHMLRVSTEPDVDSFEIQDGLGGCTTAVKFGKCGI